MKLLQKIIRFRKDRDGALTFELVLLMPTLLMLMIGMAGIFDLLAKQTDSLRATHSISDLVSRQTEVDNEFLDRLFDVYVAMSNSTEGTAAMRVTAIRETEDGSVVDWSYVAGEAQLEGKTLAALSNSSSEISTMVPNLNQGEGVVLVETYRDYNIPFQLLETVGLEDTLFTNFLVFPLRFAVRLTNSDYVTESTGSTLGHDDDDDPEDPNVGDGDTY